MGSLFSALFAFWRNFTWLPPCLDSEVGMSDELTDAAKTHALRGLIDFVLGEIRGRQTRDGLVYSLRERGLKRETARALLQVIESSNAGVSEVLDRNQELALLSRLRAVVIANYDK
jgi:hypothetical protein